VQQRAPVVVPQLTVRVDGQVQTLTLHVRPVLGEGNPANGFMVVFFEPTAEVAGELARELAPLEPIAHHLEEELIRVKTQLRLANEQHELQAEELKAANEELQAINEELRVSSEELETSKEELQSINEELTTINQELKIKVEEISLASNNLQNLINATDIATLFLDRSLRVSLFTPATRSIFNLIPTDKGRPLSDITSRLDYPQLLADAEMVLATLQPIEQEVRTTDGRVFMGRVLPYRTADDRINGLVVTLVDITARKKAEEAHYFLASIVESSQDSVLTVNFDGIITSWNKAAEALYGYAAHESIGQPLTLLTLPQDLALVLSNAEKIKQSQQVETYETVRVNKDGREMNLEVVLSPVRNASGQVIGISTVARDITARKRAEQVESLKRHTLEQQTESLAGTGSWEYNRQSGQFSWSEGMFTLFGLEPGTPVTPDVYRAVALETDWLVAERLVDRLQRSIEPFEETLRIQVKGGVRTLKITAVGLPGEGESARRLLGVDWDITEQVLAQQHLAETAQNLQAVLDSSPASIGLLKAVHDSLNADQIVDFTLAVGNQKLAEFFNEPLGGLLGQSAQRFSALLWDGQTLDILRQVYQQNQPRYDEKYLTTPQAKRWLAVSVSRQDDGLVLTGLDITELKQTQAQQQYWLDELAKASQSADLVTQLRNSLQERGELLRAASHDLRGQVGIIASATQLLGMAGSEADRSQIIDMIQRNIQQMTQLMSNLLDFSRLEAGQETSQLSRFDVAELLTELVAGARPLAAERGLLLKADGPLELAVTSDLVQVRRMAQNLLINAVKYTPSGQVTVSWQGPATDSGWQFSVADTGPGLPDAVLSRLRDETPAGDPGKPTTGSTFRSAGEGIGLSIVKRLCALLGGSFQIDSQPGLGTQFTVRFEGTVSSINDENNLNRPPV
jgi:two-component system CheB/CheR fusion protein